MSIYKYVDGIQHLTHGPTEVFKTRRPNFIALIGTYVLVVGSLIVLALYERVS